MTITTESLMLPTRKDSPLIIVNKLTDLISKLAEVKQADELPIDQCKACIARLSDSHFMQHKDDINHVPLYVATAISYVLLIMNDLHGTVLPPARLIKYACLFREQLKDFLKYTNVSYKHAYTLLGHIDKLSVLNLLVEQDVHGLPLSVLKDLFKLASHERINQNVLPYLVNIGSSLLIAHKTFVPPEIISLFSSHLVLRHTTPEKAYGRRESGLENTSNSAKFARDILERAIERSPSLVSSTLEFITAILFNADKSLRTEKENAYQFMKELTRICPNIFSLFSGSLILLLELPTELDRHLATEFVSKYLFLPEATIARDNARLLERFLHRLNDVSAPIRKTAISVLKYALAYHQDLAVQVIHLLEDRFLDHDTSAREAVLVMLRSLAQKDISLLPIAFLSRIHDRLFDVSKTVRCAALKILALIFQKVVYLQLQTKLEEILSINAPNDIESSLLKISAVLPLPTDTEMQKWTYEALCSLLLSKNEHVQLLIVDALEDALCLHPTSQKYAQMLHSGTHPSFVYLSIMANYFNILVHCADTLSSQTEASTSLSRLVNQRSPTFAGNPRLFADLPLPLTADSNLLYPSLSFRSKFTSSFAVLLRAPDSALKQTSQKLFEHALLLTTPADKANDNQENAKLFLECLASLTSQDKKLLLNALVSSETSTSTKGPSDLIASLSKIFASKRIQQVPILKFAFQKAFSIWLLEGHLLDAYTLGQHLTHQTCIKQTNVAGKKQNPGQLVIESITGSARLLLATEDQHLSPLFFGLIFQRTLENQSASLHAMLPFLESMLSHVEGLKDNNPLDAYLDSNSAKMADALTSKLYNMLLSLHSSSHSPNPKVVMNTYVRLMKIREKQTQLAEQLEVLISNILSLDFNKFPASASTTASATSRRRKGSLSGADSIETDDGLLLSTLQGLRLLIYLVSNHFSNTIPHLGLMLDHINHVLQLNPFESVQEYEVNESTDANGSVFIRTKTYALKLLTLILTTIHACHQDADTPVQTHTPDILNMIEGFTCENSSPCDAQLNANDRFVFITAAAISIMRLSVIPKLFDFLHPASLHAASLLAHHASPYARSKFLKTMYSLKDVYTLPNHLVSMLFITPPRIHAASESSFEACFRDLVVLDTLALRRSIYNYLQKNQNPIKDYFLNENLLSYLYSFLCYSKTSEFTLAELGFVAEAIIYFLKSINQKQQELDHLYHLEVIASLLKRKTFANTAATYPKNLYLCCDITLKYLIDIKQQASMNTLANHVFNLHLVPSTFVDASKEHLQEYTSDANEHKGSSVPPEFIYPVLKLKKTSPSHQHRGPKKQIRLSVETSKEARVQKQQPKLKRRKSNNHKSEMAAAAVLPKRETLSRMAKTSAAAAATAYTQNKDDSEDKYSESEETDDDDRQETSSDQDSDA